MRGSLKEMKSKTKQTYIKGGGVTKPEVMPSSTILTQERTSWPFVPHVRMKKRVA